MSLANVKLKLVQDVDDAREFLEWLARNRTEAIGVDTESTGFKYHGDDYVRLAQVGCADYGWAFDWTRWNGLFSAALADHTGPLDLMNAKFDWSFLAKAGLKLDRWRIRDVGVMAHVRESHMSRALKNQGKRWVDPLAGALQGELDRAFSENKWTWATVPTDFELYWAYAALDPVLTRRLSDIHLPVVLAEAPYAYEIDNSYTWVAQGMEAYGVHIDVEYARANQVKFERYCEESAAWCQAEYGVSPGSNQAVVRVLSEAGYEFTKATKAGAISLDSEVLEGIDHPLAQVVLKRRRLQKLASTYLDYYANNADADGIIHPSLNTLGARTGRSSMSDPNLQNLPRVSEKNPAATVVRNCVSARPDHTLLFCDFDQIEMRLLAAFSGDEGLIDAFRQPEDFFVTVARAIFNDPTLVKSDPRRQPTKNSMYASIYGAGIAKQAQTAGVTFDQMKYVSDQLNARFPGKERFSRATYDEAMRDGYTTCPITGRRHYAEIGHEYALTNYKIQGAAAAIFKLKMLELTAAGLGDWMVAPVHDEVILDVPNEHVPDAVHTLQQVMNDAKLLAVPITASVSYGQRWGQKKEWRG